jgi:caspase domain-containing protein
MKRANLNLMLGAAGLMVVLVVLEARSLIPVATATAHSRLNSEPQSSGVAAKPTKRALLIGINNYKYPDRVPSLAGSLNDVEDMREVLIGKFEFPSQNILVLKDSQATHAQIISAIQTHLIAKTQPGDIVVFHYSGHGSQMKDVTGKMISGLDETIVPYDSRDPEGEVFDISGAELHLTLVRLAERTRNATFILDSCHSGTLVRGARVRSIPPDTRSIPPATMTAMRGLTSADDRASPKFAFVAAATSSENAFEYSAEGKQHGLLTYFLTRQLRAAGAGATYRDVMDSVIGNVTANYPTQHPSLEGAEADQHIFGDGTSLAATYVPASPSQSDTKVATLHVGQVQGATVGSIYAVYPPSSKKFAPPEQPTAKVQLASVDDFTSTATILPGGKVAPASRAVEIAHRYGSSRLLVYLDGVDKSPLFQSIRDQSANLNYIEIVDRPTRCNVQLRQEGQSVQTLAADSSPLSPPVPLNDPSAAKKLMAQLQMWAKWFKVLSIRNSQAGLDISFEIKGSQTRDPAGQIGKPDMGVNEGETITATLTNNSEHDLYVAILDLSSDGSISVAYPTQQGTEEVLKPQLTLSRTFTTFVPKERSTVTDVLKVFASYTPIDLTPLTQGTVRGLNETAEADPLEELLLDSTGVSRGVSLNKPLDLGTWTTVQRVLRVKRKT